MVPKKGKKSSLRFDELFAGAFLGPSRKNVFRFLFIFFSKALSLGCTMLVLGMIHLV
jgi:hypothetical protein